jgi:hypothetical protein
MAFLTAGESVERMAAYCRVEQLLFGLLGGWAAEIELPAAKLSLLNAADHSAWRAKRWFEMLPTAPPGPDALLTPAEVERETFNLIVDLVGDSQGARMAVAYEELLPGLHAAMSAHLERTTAVADGPIRRLLNIAITDISNDSIEGLGPMELVMAAAENRAAAERVGAELAAANARIGHIFGA